MQYRREIDGLRAVAVMPVLMFHGGIETFSGGFVGVDIFFVISGFLITSIILGEVRQDKFSIINFYERRARRILPALSLVLLATSVAAFIFMPPEIYREFSQSVVSVSVFMSNFFFFLETGYFAQAAEEMPLLHTWSLAVEEQYYVFFPVMVALMWAFARKALFSTILIITIISLLICEYFSTGDYKDANFFLIFSRAWELFFGSIIAYISADKLPRKTWQREGLSILGFVMIIYSIFFFDKSIPFPSFYTLIPVVGTCLVIVFSNEHSIVGRILSLRAVVFIGLISYSLYLWHQPIFAFLRLKSIGLPGDEVFLSAIVVSIILASISWKWVEAPFRDKKRMSRATIFKCSAASIALFLSFGLAGHFYNGFDGRFGVPAYNKEDILLVERDECMTGGENYLKPVDACSYDGDNITWAVFGDSHSNMLARPLAERLVDNNEGILHLSYSGCMPAVGLKIKEKACADWSVEALNHLESHETVENVILAYRHSRYLYGDQTLTYPDVPNVDFRESLDEDYAVMSLADAHNLYWQSFEEIVDRLRAAGKTVHILYPVPELPIDIEKAITPFSIFNRSPLLDLDKVTTLEYYLERNQQAIDRLNAFEFGDQLKSIIPTEILCADEHCFAALDKKILYRDDNHLNINGVNELLDLALNY